MAEPTYFREVSIQYKGQRQRAFRIRGPESAVQWLRPRIGGESREHFVALFLDARHAVIGFQTVSVGTATASLVHPREVFQPALIAGACAVIIAHNHPSGDPSPSIEDGQMTRRLIAAGKVLGVQVLDSLVIGDEAWASHRDTTPEDFETV